MSIALSLLTSPTINFIYQEVLEPNENKLIKRIIFVNCLSIDVDLL